MRNHGTAGSGLLVAAHLLFHAAASAQPGVPHSAPAPPHPEPPHDALGRTTPRGTVLGFLLAARKGDNGAAAQYLNTRASGATAAALAQKLFVVLDRRLPARLNQLSDKPEGSLPFLTRPNQDVVGTIATDDGNVDVVVERTDQGNGLFLWLFSRKTLEAIPSLYQEFDVAAEGAIPGFLRRTSIGGVPLFEWLALLVGMPLLHLLTALLNRLVTPLLRRILRRLNKRADQLNIQFLPVPVRLLFMAWMIRWGMSKVSLPLLARAFWSNTATMIAIVACVWMLIRLNGIGESFLHRRMVRLNRSGATSILTLGRRAVDSLILFAGILVAFRHFGVNLTAALAGLGVGGIAIALAAQKTLENIIGGISVVFDQTVRAGDQVRVADHTGTVEHIGLRSTRIRTFDRTLVSIPNGQLSNVSLENISCRDKFWFHHTLTLNYDTSASAMRAILDGVNELLVQHSSVESASVRVSFLGFGASSLKVELCAYVMADGWGPFLKTQQALLLDSMEIVHAAGTRLAYPSQTLYLERSNALSVGAAASTHD